MGISTPKVLLMIREITDTGDDGKIAAGNPGEDFQFAFSGLMGGQGVHSAEKPSTYAPPERRSGIITQTTDRRNS